MSTIQYTPSFTIERIAMPKRKPEYLPSDSPHALTVVTPRQQIDALIDLAVNAVDSEHSKRAYRDALEQFLSWYSDQGRPQLTKAVINAYKTHLQEKVLPSGKHLSASTINVRLSAVRKLIAEAADNDLVEPVHANAIRGVKGVKREGVRMGNWLTKAEAQKLLNAPDPTTVKGLRDRAILAVLLGCALRREECASLTVEHFQQREGRWLIVDLIGKRGKVRSVPVPSWVKAALDDWTDAASITAGPIWRGMNKGDGILVNEPGLSAQAIWRVVDKYAARIGHKGLAPHDMRRTSAKLMRAGEASLEQIQFTLGHSSLDTTKRYLGTELDLQDAATDRIGLKLEHRQRRLPEA